MTTSKTLPIVSLCFETASSFEANLEKLLSLLQHAPENSLIVAPEVCLSGFCYDRFEDAADFTEYALPILMEQTGERLLIFTAITRKEEGMYNIAYAIHNGNIIHTQGKAKLFALGGENEHFASYPESAIIPFEFQGLSLGILICFELRFKKLWQQLEGCDLIAVPAQWGKLRKEHFSTLTNALAIMNQCYVVASDAANEDTTALSGIITPFGGEIRNNGTEALFSQFESRTVASMRRYLNVGIGQ